MFNITLQPSQVELIAKPGATVTQAYEITNNSPNQITLISTIRQWLPDGTDGSVKYIDNQNHQLVFSLNNSDLQLGQEFTLNPGQTRQLVLKIKSSPSFSTADGYYTFFISQSPSSQINAYPNQSSASGQIGSHLLLTYSNSTNIYPELSIKNLHVLPQFKDTFLSPIKITGQIHNNSPHYHRPSGKIIITKNNLTIKELEIFPNNVLGKSARDINCLSDNQPQPCQINPPFWPGQYSINVQIDTASATTTFYVFPYSITVVFLIMLTLLFLGRKFIYRHEK